MSDEGSKIAYVEGSFRLQISSQPLTETDLVRIRDGLRALVHWDLVNKLDVFGDHDIELSDLDIESVEERWDLEASGL
jgi:hypothetical protein